MVVCDGGVTENEIATVAAATIATIMILVTWRFSISIAPFRSGKVITIDDNCAKSKIPISEVSRIELE